MAKKIIKAVSTIMCLLVAIFLFIAEIIDHKLDIADYSFISVIIYLILAIQSNLKEPNRKIQYIILCNFIFNTLSEFVWLDLKLLELCVFVPILTICMLGGFINLKELNNIELE